MGQTKGHINIKLFIECKYITQEFVFWFHDKNMNKARELVLATTPLPDTHVSTEKHHYLSGNKRVAKLFASDNRKASENEPFYKALNQSLNAMVYYRDGDSIIPPLHRGYRNTLSIVNYPIIICNSFNTFYKVDIEKTDAPENIKDNFQLEVNYAYMDVNKNHRNEYFLIDVVNYEEADKFLEILQQDIDAISAII